MDEITEKLAKFVTEVQFGDLPEKTVHDAKYVLLDMIGVATLGVSTELGQKALEFARRLGGPAESSVIGTSDKLSCTNAAFANAQLMCAIDYDAISTIHDVPYLLPAPLAMVETTQTSGENLLVAIAIALELSKRIAFATPTLWGMSASTFGAAAAAGRIMKLNQEKMANAIGLAGYICPPDTMEKWIGVCPTPMVKYGLSGWGAQAGVSAALLADIGFTGDTEVFKGENAYWRYTGKTEWNSEAVVKGLGETWLSRGVKIKPYPAGM